MLTVIIIEDERLTALDLVNTLKKIDPDIFVQVILDSVESAIDYLKNNNQPDLIFSDIQLADGTSFDIFEQIKIIVPVIFCTAYNQYALKAFEANGIAYLLKPFDKITVAKAIDKFLLFKGNLTPHDILLQLKNTLNNPISSPIIKSIIVNHGEKIIPVPIDDIALFYLEDKYSFALTFDQKKFITSHSIEELEKLTGNLFFRANRQHLVNRNAIKEAVRHLNRRLRLHVNIEFQETIFVSKLKAPSFLDWLAGGL